MIFTKVFTLKDTNDIVLAKKDIPMKETEIYQEFIDFLKKHNLKNVICFNNDNGQMGVQQAFQFAGTGDDRYLVLAFSSSDQTVCPCCREKEKEDGIH